MIMSLECWKCLGLVSVANRVLWDVTDSHCILVNNHCHFGRYAYLDPHEMPVKFESKLIMVQNQACKLNT